LENAAEPAKENALIILTGIFTASLVAANLLGSRLIEVFGVTVSIGLFVFPFTFLTADIMTELFGKRSALRVVRTGIVLQIYVLLFVMLGAILPGSAHRATDDSYRSFFALTPRMVVASIVAYSVSQVLDVKIFARLRDRNASGSILLRTNIAAWTSQFVDSLLFMSIFLGGVLPLNAWVKSFAVAYLAKVVVTTFHSPFVKIGTAFFRRRMRGA